MRFNLQNANCSAKKCGSIFKLSNLKVEILPLSEREKQKEKNGGGRMDGTWLGWVRQAHQRNQPNKRNLWELGS